MDHGEIVERGTHAQLLAQNGYYSRLHAMGLDEPVTAGIACPPRREGEIVSPSRIPGVQCVRGFVSSPLRFLTKPE
jgi:hypothetical protein